MPDNTEFIQLIKDKCAGRHYNVEEYVTKIDALIADVYTKRYGSLSGPRWRGFLYVDFEDFQNNCWEGLEDKGLVLKFRDVSFSNDFHLFSYMKKSFETMLLDKVYALSPGSRTRMKQVQRVLKPHVLDSCLKFCACWKLREYRTTVVELADLDQLTKTAQYLVPPDIHIRKTSDGHAVPTIRDKDMEHYLLTLLNKVGGMTTRNALFTLITNQYDLWPVKKAVASEKRHTEAGGDEESPEEQLDRAHYDTGDTLIGADHWMMAEKIVAAMNPRMRDVYYRRIICGETMEETARSMKKSVGTTYNIEKEYQKIIFEHLWDHETAGLCEEEACVGRLVSDLVMRMREQNEK